MGDEDHDDILQVLLELIRSHGAPVYVVWVEAHRGDPGNYMADYYANLRCAAENDVLFDRPSDPFQLWDLMAGTLLSPHGWKGKVQKHAEQFQTLLCYASLDTPDACWTTASLVRDNRARDILGEVITDKSTPQLAVRDLLQARSFVWPTQAQLVKYKKATCDQCPFGCRTKETFSHVQMTCPQFAEGRTEAHNLVATRLIAQIQTSLPGALCFYDKSVAWLHEH